MSERKLYRKALVGQLPDIHAGFAFGSFLKSLLGKCTMTACS